MQSLDSIQNFQSAHRKKNFLRNKDNEKPPFLNTFAAVSLLYNFPFSKSNGLASALQRPFRTGSKHPKKRVAPHAGLGTEGGNITKEYNR